MRLLWVCCLLVGAISCSPVKKGPGFGVDSDPMRQPYFSGYVYGETGRSDSFVPARPMQSPDGAAGPSSSYGSNMAGGEGGYENLGAEPEVALDAGQTGYYVWGAPAEESWVPVAGDPNEPVLSDVSGLEPVYSFGSRSRYQRGRMVYAETSYTPTGPAVPPVFGPDAPEAPEDQSMV
ncbi:uncharacterized protein LOC114451533 isoform X2 [Parambassis ranga]|uniref:Uncharacterized protein LOC114451533 isoform X2 n=1 Tax=Parambassis ranga TaxID=210632 RepID=A0A6P7K978_9TELE|nr:uncharacterized protein LOC114451533 isoform X2 [Parambassis ranga]